MLFRSDNLISNEVSYLDVVPALLAGHVDIAWNSPLAWVDAQRRLLRQSRIGKRKLQAPTMPLRRKLVAVVTSRLFKVAIMAAVLANTLIMMIYLLLAGAWPAETRQIPAANMAMSRSPRRPQHRE